MELADELIALARLPEAERRAMGERGRAFVRQHYDWRVLARDLIGTLEQLKVRSVCLDADIGQMRIGQPFSLRRK